MDNFLFLHVEEGFKRVKQTLEFQELAGLMIWERARCQYLHIKGLEEWKQQISDGMDKIYDDGDCDVQMLVNLLKEEAILTQGVHQSLHHKLMDQDGPYHAIMNDVKKARNKHVQSELKGLEDEFEKVNSRRKILQEENQKHKQAMNHIKSTLIMLDEQLSKRSRIADTRRSSARGVRKIDNIQARASTLRRQKETLKKIQEKGENDLSSLIKSNKKKLIEMLRKLKDLDRQRLGLIYRESQEYINTIKRNALVSNGNKFPYKLDEIIQHLSSIDIDKIIEESWSKVESSARQRKTGQLIGCKGSFVPHNLRPKESKIHRQTGVQLCKDIHDPSDDGDMATFTVSGENFRSCESRNSMYGTSCESSTDTIYQVRKDNSRCSESSSGSRIETIVIPEDSIFTKRLPPPFPTREFCVSNDEEDDDAEEARAASPVPSTMAQAIQDMENLHFIPRQIGNERDKDPETLIRGMREIRVLAKYDYKATQKNELTVRKGQVIKQKMGEDENGMSYGWTRGSKFSPKQYGWYPSDLAGQIISAKTFPLS